MYSRSISRILLLLVSTLLAACPSHNKNVRTAEGRCPLILSTESEEGAGIGGEVAYKGVELGKGHVNVEQMEKFKVELDRLQTDYNNMSHDMCIDWANGALTNAQYNTAKNCLRTTHKKMRILQLGLESGTVDKVSFYEELKMLVAEMDKCGSSQAAPVPADVQAQSSQGATCASDAQCEPPLYCILGGCRPIGQAGAQCEFDWDCTQPLVCQGGICAQPAAKSTVTGTPCATDDSCQAPLYCILSTCRYLGNVGDACQLDYDCNKPYLCISGQCTQPDAGTVLGTPCTGDANCTPPLFCIKKTCRPLGNPGDACDIDQDCFSPYVCSAGYCAVQGLPEAYAPPTHGGGGQACSDDGDCVQPEYCIVGQCRELQGDGGVCNLDADCQSGLKCTGGACSW